MTKILSTASATSTLVSTLAASLADTVRAAISGFRLASHARVESLAARLRYDIGEIDINPDCVRGGNPHEGTALDREIMRRGF